MEQKTIYLNAVQAGIWRRRAARLKKEGGPSMSRYIMGLLGGMEQRDRINDEVNAFHRRKQVRNAED